jgi:molybdopterin molybdotransferase
VTTAGPTTATPGARSQPDTGSQTAIRWDRARAVAHAAGMALARPAIDVPLADADGLTLAIPLTTLTDLPAFSTSSVDGWAVRGNGPWRIIGQILAGDTAPHLSDDGTCVEIATGAMVPDGAEAIVRTEESHRDGDHVSGQPRPAREWRDPGDEAHRGEELLPAGTPVTPGVVGLAASCGYDTLSVYPRPEAALLVFGDELLTSGTPAGGRIRDSLGPSLPAWLHRLGATRPAPIGPVEDTLVAHVDAIRQAAETAQVVCTTGGTMHGPVDHLHPALAELGAEYLANTVAVRPGFPMLLARLPGGQLLCGLPGNPQSAVVALVTLVAPLLAGLTGRPLPATDDVPLGAPIPGRGDHTHLALVHVSREDGCAYPLKHSGSSMLRGLAHAAGFAVVAPGGAGEPGMRLPLVPLPLLAGERP